ncbi:MAG: FAD-dependent oxidoreductase [Acidimicrobiia bacterium]|nr:FAD-dependent oxidoreductase [Acidimicrobiia bacterium]
MKTSAQVVVIGGGVVGASVLYHLTRNGWTDVVLLERDELTAGSTWHSAGGMHTLNGDPNVAKLQQYTIELYREIEELSGRDCGIHITGGCLLADTPERLDWLKMAHARGRYLGMETELISLDEAKAKMPFMDTSYFVGAMWDAHEGHVDPTGVTNAYATVARNNGAEVYRKAWAQAITPVDGPGGLADAGVDGRWDVHVHDPSTGEPKGVIRCEHVVNAGGLWAREVGRMVGLELPLLAMEHMYLITEPIPELAEFNANVGEMSHAIDFAGEIYMRQEGAGLLLGTYERNCVPWSPGETPWDFGMRLLTPDLERIAESLDTGFKHFPIFAEVGIKQVVNGPFTFAPDGNPLLGPVRGLPGFWSACAVMAGLSQGGGVGLALANWMTEGDPGFDVWGMDIARFGDFATKSWTHTKVRENYSRRFRIQFPNEFLPEGRPLQTSPVYDRLSAANAVWGNAFGLESALWFQADGLDPTEDVTFGRSNAWDQVRAETLAVRDGVGLMETTGFSKFEFTGPGARAFLDHLSTNTVPRAGRMALAPMVNHNGKLIGDLTIACLAGAGGEALGPSSAITAGATANTARDERFVVFGSGIAERYYERWFDRALAGFGPDQGSVAYRTLGYEVCGLSIAGPDARNLLASVTDDDVSNEAFRFMAFRSMNVGWAPVWCGRVSFTGDLGYELWMPSSYQRYVFDLLTAAGADHGLRLFGLHALNSLRLDKGFGGWAREYRPIYDPYEAGLDRFVKLDKTFVGRDALAAAAEAGPQRRLLTWTVETEPGLAGADVIGDEPVWYDGDVVGWVTSGGYSHFSDTSVALGYVPAELEGATGRFEIEVVGDRRAAQLVDGCLWDPEATRMRA